MGNDPTLGQDHALLGKTVRVVTLDGFEDYTPLEYITRIVKEPIIDFPELLKGHEPKLPDNYSKLQNLSFIMGRGSGKVLMQRRLMIQFLFPEVFKCPTYVEHLFHGKEKFINV